MKHRGRLSRRQGPRPTRDPFKSLHSARVYAAKRGWTIQGIVSHTRGDRVNVVTGGGKALTLRVKDES